MNKLDDLWGDRSWGAFGGRVIQSSFPLWFLLFYFIIPALLSWEELEKRFLLLQPPGRVTAIVDLN